LSCTEVRERPGPGLLLLESPALGRIGCLGADHLVDALRQPSKRRTVEVLRLLDQVRLRSLLDPGRQVVVLSGE
jgi:hypothetical protein